MSLVCDVTGKKVITGCNVSHANNRTKRRFLPNIQVKRFKSDSLNSEIKLRITTNAVRTIDKYDSFDEFIMSHDDREFSDRLKRIKKFVSRKSCLSDCSSAV